MTKIVGVVSFIFLTMLGLQGSGVNDGGYDELWQEVLEFENQRKPKSALAVIEKIYAKANRESEQIQLTKAVIYKSKFILQTQEEGYDLVVDFFKQEIAKSPSPTKEILLSVEATIYKQYLNQNRWKIQQRSRIDDFADNDPQTWPTNTFVEKIADNFKASISNPEVLNKPLRDYDELLYIYDEETLIYYPTLYDLLAYRAVTFFTSSDSYLTSPVYQFTVHDEKYMGTVQDFESMEIATQDSSSMLYQGLLVLQKHLKYNTDRPEARAFINMQRVDLIYNQSRAEDKEEWYLARLKELEIAYKDLSVLPGVYARLARYYNNKGHLDRTIRTDDFKTALGYCKKAINNFPEAPATSECVNIHNSITAQNLNITGERAYPSGKDLLVKLDHKNIEKVYFELVSLNRSEIEKLQKARNNYNEVFLTIVKSKKSLRKWSKKVYNDGKHYSLSSELSIAPLPVGSYAIIASTTSDVYADEGLSRVLVLSITDLTYKVLHNANTVYVTDRTTGKPIKDATVICSEREYIQQTRENIKIKVGSYRTDSNGAVVIKKDENKRYLIDLEYGKDYYLSEDNHYYHRPYRNSGDERTVIYTDRSIYRPGQTVFYKILQLSTDQYDIPSIVKNEEIEITFYDANRQVVSEVELETNEYGTASGSFVIPKGSLNGVMTLESDYEGSVNFRVEEYKRPKFEVEALPLEAVYQLNDSVTVKVKAKSYAGATIDNAQVVYRVTRGVSFPWWHWGCGFRYPSVAGGEMEITNGTAVTNKDGIVEIVFKAVSLNEVLPKWNPLYVYTVTADITDSNGETHSTIQNVRIGQRTRLLDIYDLPEPYITGDNNQSVKIRVTDLNDQDKEGKGVIEILSLQQPDHVKNNRYWNHPDRIMLLQEDFEDLHPNYAWIEEDVKSWKVKEQVATIAFDQTGVEELELPKLRGGVYKLIARMKDVDGVEIIKESYLNALNFKKKQFPTTNHLFYTLDKKSYSPGDKLKLSLGTSSDKLTVLYSLEKKRKIADQKWIEISGKKELKIPIVDSDQGGFVINLSYIKNNRPHQEQIRVEVPWSSKNLNIEFQSFRDKTLPGSEEQYSLKISGPDKDKVSAELLACMYDASLDDFVGHGWNSDFYPSYYSTFSMSTSGFTSLSSRYYRHSIRKDFIKHRHKNLVYPRLHDFGMGFHYNYRSNWYYDRRSMASPEDYGVGGVDLEESISKDMVVVKAYRSPRIEQDNTSQGYAVTTEEIRSLPTRSMNAISAESAGISSSDADENISIRGSRGDASNYYVDGISVSESEIPQVDVDGNPVDKFKVAIRENLDETVFFYPHLRTDKEGNVIVSFKMNEALTRWKFMAMAHTQDLEVGMVTKEVVTQKDLMVVPNPPRFVRDNDEIIFTSKINNLTNKEIWGQVKIELLDAISLQPLEGIIAEDELVQDFKIEASQSTVAKWKMNIPEREVDAITYRVIAVSGSHSDGEENVLPVLTNRMLVTETMPITVNPLETADFTFDELQNAESSVVHHNYTMEYTANPAWYAVQAMPYISDRGSSAFDQLYVNELASSIVNKHPRIKAVFDQWKSTDSDALESNLEKNQELKTAILKETPWVQNALSESEQKKNIALLFDLNQIANSRKESISRLVNLQKSDGGFGWYSSERSDRYTSQGILEGLGHLSRLGISIKEDAELKPLLDRLINYADEEIRKEYEKRDVNKRYLSKLACHYLYVRSFFSEVLITMQADEAFEYYLNLAEAKILDHGIYVSGMLGLALNRFDRMEGANKITESLLERALIHPELGMYWNEGNGFNWYELPIERHAMMMELMVEMDQDEVIDDLKLWLLRNKQTNHWKTTKATAAAIYALLIENEEKGISKWVLEAKVPTIKVGGQLLDFSNDVEAGTGYVKKSYSKTEIDSAIAKIEISNPNKHVGWGGVYWQYFEDMDKIKTFEKTPLKLRKTLYKKILDDRGEKIVPVTDQNIKIGEKLLVRIELEADRSMEYLHLKDMRASGLEPMSTLSGYKWSHGLGYYQSTRDLAIDFFISYLPKGKYVFEYELRASHEGSFSNGITTIQSMYAPEYTSHSNGQEILISDNN